MENANERQITDTDHNTGSNPALDSITVSYGNRIDNPRTTSKPLTWVLDEIRTSPHLATNIATVRSHLGDDEARREAKKTLLPYFTFASFKDGKRDKASFLKTKYVISDLDHVKQLDELKEALKKDEYVMSFFVSPSSDGLKVVFELEKEATTVAEYEAAFYTISERIYKLYGVRPGPEKDPSRACFLSYDPDLYVNEGRKPITRNASLPPATPDVQVNLPKSGKAILETLQGASEGGRHHNAINLAGYLLRYGIPEDVSVELATGINEARNNPPKDRPAIEAAVRDSYERYATQSRIKPVEFRQIENSYFKVSRNGHGETMNQVTTFAIHPLEILVLDSSDCLRCNVTSAQGHSYENVLIENRDWLSKVKLLSAIGHQDCTFLGSDNDVQALCDFINRQVEVRKTATKVIGLIGEAWVAEGLNITSRGMTTEPDIVPYDKGNGAFYHKIAYSQLSDTEYKSLVEGFYAEILTINHESVILPFLGWIFAAPIKEIIRAKLGSFPSLLVHGGQGSGKTSTAKMFMRLAGYKTPIPYKCDMKPFPMLKNLSSTNGIPQFYDEFKQADMKPDIVDSLLRYVREIYDGELEQKGREDQTTVDYELLAPMALLGEWNINQPAIRERVLMVRFSDSVKKVKRMREAFGRLLDLSLEGFMPRYIQFCLSQDIDGILTETRRYVEWYFEGKNVAPRIQNNLAVMLLGLELFQEYAIFCGVPMPRFHPDQMLDAQLKEITGTDTGSVRSAVDQLIEGLGVMWQRSEKLIQYTSSIGPIVEQYPWWKIASVDGESTVAIRFGRAFSEFKEYARRTSYEGDLLDERSYYQMFKETDYIAATNHSVDMSGKKCKCLCVSIEKAKAAGVDLEGFGV